MVLKRVILVVCLLFSIGRTQELFYTDSYLSNFFVSNEEKIAFHNNVFELIDETTKDQVLLLIKDYFQNEKIEVEYLKSTNPGQLVFAYESPKFEAIRWSKEWHLNYEPKLNQVLKLFLSTYFNKALSPPENIKEAALMKLAYYDWQNYQYRASDFSKTRLNFSTSNVNPPQFIRDNIVPNLSLTRIVTNSFQNFFNEAYLVSNIKSSTHFVFGPSDKARLKDCLSMYIYTHSNQLPPPTYLSNQTVLLKPPTQRVVEGPDLIKWLDYAKLAIRDKAHDFQYSFYTNHDFNILPQLVEKYTLSDYLDFQRIYFEENSYNIAQPPEKMDSCFNKAILNSQVNFKLNAIQFQSSNDSLLLQNLALFLQHNPSVQLVLIGSQEKEEYTKIDKTKFRKLVDSYKEYPPVKSSKRADLAIYRSVVVFDFLVKHGIQPKRISCLSNKSKTKEVSNTKVYWVVK